MENKSVLFFCGASEVFGKEKSMLGIMLGLKKRGFDVKNISNSWNNGQFISMLKDAKIPFDQVRIGKISKSLKWPYIWWTFEALINLPFGLYKIMAIINKNNPSILFFDTPYTLFFLSFFRLNHFKLVIRHAEDPEKNFFLRQVNKGRYGHRIVHLAVSKYIFKKLVESGIPQDQITLVYTGVTPLGQAKIQYFTNRTITIGCIGQLGPWKGQEILIDALNLIVNTEKHNVICKIIGSGELLYKEAIARKIKKMVLENNVILEGYSNTIGETYKEIDLVVVPTVSEEPLARVPIEAGLQGVPSIVSNMGGLTEIVEDGITGFILPSITPQAIAKKIVFFIQNPEWLKTMGLNAKNKYTIKFSQTQQLDKLELILRK